jgi:type IV pilus assembly protein PilE
MAAMLTSSHSRPQCVQAGFTIIELMIVVVLVAVVAMVALPSYQDSVRKGRRSEAFGAIAAVQLAQERARGNFPSYCPNLASAPTSSVCGLNVQTPTTNGRYALDISTPAPTADGYTLIATAQGDQSGDTRCAKMGVQVNGGTIKRGSGSASIDWGLTDPDPNRCWAK